MVRIFALVTVCLLAPLAARGQDLDFQRLQAATEKGLSLIQAAADRYPQNRDCYSCHHQGVPVLAMTTAREAGLEIDAEIFAKQIEFTRKSFAGRSKRLQAGRGIGGVALTVSYGLWTLELGAHPPDETTAAMVSYLLKTQKEDGHWARFMSRPPLEDSNVTCTVLSCRQLKVFARGKQREAAEKAVGRGQAWLAKAELASSEDHAARLWGLHLLGGDEELLQAARQQVLALQRKDGGWPQLREMSSDAYATGQALYVLQVSGLSARDPRCVRGAKYLLDAQQPDGSWHVKSRSKPVQVWFDNGDPHGKDQFISTTATAWAVAALSQALQAKGEPTAGDE